MGSLRRASHRVSLGSLLFLLTIAWHVEAIAAQLQLSWTDSSTNENGFAIERATETTGTFAQVTTTGAGVTSYADSSLADTTTYCYRVRAFNATGYSDYSNVACATTPQSFGLAVVETGTGGGTVSSSPTGITCGTSCSASFPSGTAVALTASPAADSGFTGWSGGGCSGTGSCTVTLTVTTTVTSTFDLQAVALTVSTGGNGSGTITSSPAGINCDTSCSANFPTGMTVTLTVSPDTGSTFMGWSGGGCSGTGSCTVTMAGATSVTANFKRHKSSSVPPGAQKK